jgi:hypothetical protein
MTGAPRRQVGRNDGGGGDDDQDEDFGAGVRTADAELMESAGVAQGEFAAVNDGVVADAEMGSGSMPGGPAFGRVV